VKSIEIYEGLTVQYGHNYLSHWKVYDWVERFKAGRRSVGGALAGLPNAAMY
jgi:hypothetical protein